METWAIFLIVVVGILALSLIITCCSACCLLTCSSSCCRSNPLCCLAATLLACVGLQPRTEQRPYIYYSGSSNQYGAVAMAEAAVVIPPPPRVVYRYVRLSPGGSTLNYMKILIDLRQYTNTLQPRRPRHRAAGRRSL